MALTPISRSVEVNAPIEEVFAILADPQKHPELDGSGTVRGCDRVELPLRVGSRFVMNMKLPMVIPYRSVNEIVELDPPTGIAWKTTPKSRTLGIMFGGQTWRFDLEPTNGGCRVTETWDPSTLTRPTVGVRAMRFQTSNVSGIESTLARLKQHWL